MSTFHSTSFWPDATTSCDSSLTSPSIDVRIVTATSRSLSSRAAMRRWARAFVGVAAQHPQAVDPDRPRCRRTCTGRHSPPGFQAVDVECWKTPVMLRRPVVEVCGEHVTSTARTWSSANRDSVGDVERVREEVALGVAEVRAVEPHVGLVEDAVERDPASSSVGWRRGGERVSVQQRAVGGRRTRGCCASGRGPGPASTCCRRCRGRSRCGERRRRRRLPTRHRTVPSIGWYSAVVSRGLAAPWMMASPLREARSRPER